MMRNSRIDPARLAFLEKRHADAMGVVHSAYQEMVELGKQRRRLRDRIGELEFRHPVTSGEAASKAQKLKEFREQLAEIEPLHAAAQAAYDAENNKATAASVLLQRCREYAGGGARA